MIQGGDDTRLTLEAVGELLREILIATLRFKRASCALQPRPFRLANAGDNLVRSELFAGLEFHFENVQSK